VASSASWSWFIIILKELEFLIKLFKNTVLYTESTKRKTVNAMDVVMAFKKEGWYLYGFDPIK